MFVYSEYATRSLIGLAHCVSFLAHYAKKTGLLHQRSELFFSARRENFFGIGHALPVAIDAFRRSFYDQNVHLNFGCLKHDGCPTRRCFRYDFSAL
jgi:hypothetical protein